jgi:hypothetical protein
MSMAVANSKHVSESALSEIRVQNEAVLILFLRIARHVADPRRKGVLSHYVLLSMHCVPLLGLLNKHFWLLHGLRQAVQLLLRC